MHDDASPRLLAIIEPASGSDRQQTEELTQRLLSELEQIPGLEVSRTLSGPPPPGSKPGGEAFSLGQLVLTLVQSGGVLVTIIGVVRTWLARQNANSVELKCGDFSS
jgi:hypothetical protein